MARQGYTESEACKISTKMWSDHQAPKFLLVMESFLNDPIQL